MNKSLELMKQNPPKSWWSPILVVVITFLIVGSFSSIASVFIVSLITGEQLSVETTSISGSLGALFGFTASLIAILLWNKKKNKRSAESLGFTRTGIIKNYLIGFVLAVVFLTIIMAIAYLLGGYKFSLSSNVSIALIIFSLLGFGIQGMTEEVLCRGYIMNSVATKKSMTFAVIANSLVFAILHSFNNAIGVLPLINLFIFGLVFSALYLATDNMWLTGAAHSAWNFALAVVYGVNVSGNKFITNILSADPTGSALINGGDFGVEASLVTTLLGIVAIVLCLYIYKRKQSQLSE